MQETRIGLKQTLLLCFLVLPIDGLAVAETFKGSLFPYEFEPEVPIVVELESSAGTLSGKIKMSLPLMREGPIISGEKIGDRCDLKSDIGKGESLGLHGNCTSTTFNGFYTLYLQDKKRHKGTFKLDLVKPEKRKKRLSESEQRKPSTATNTACLKANNTCLAACPRGDYNTEFICANTCRHKMQACKARVKKLTRARQD